MSTDAAFGALGVAVGSSTIEIKRAFRELTRSAHPDRGGDAQRFVEIVSAYRELQRAGLVPDERVHETVEPTRIPPEVVTTAETTERPATPSGTPRLASAPEAEGTTPLRPSTRAEYHYRRFVRSLDLVEPESQVVSDIDLRPMSDIDLRSIRLPLVSRARLTNRKRVNRTPPLHVPFTPAVTKTGAVEPTPGGTRVTPFTPAVTNTGAVEPTPGRIRVTPFTPAVTKAGAVESTSGGTRVTPFAEILARELQRAD